MKRSNPFLPRANFFGQSARLKHWEGGFHTTPDENFAVPYAQQKFETSEISQGREDPEDYPVVLTLDMTGLVGFADIDARRACLEIFDRFLKHHDEMDFEAGFESLIEELEAQGYGGYGSDGQPVVDVLFKLASASSDDVVNTLALAGINDTQDYIMLRKCAFILSTKGENARMPQYLENFLRDLFKQSVYWNPIPDERLLEVRYMHPYFRSVVGEYRFEEESEIFDEYAENGWEFLTDEDSFIAPVFKPAWTREVKDVPFGFETPAPARVEYHGTSLSNLLLACPWLSKKLADPPPPQKGGIKGLLKRMKEK